MKSTIEKIYLENAGTSTVPTTEEYRRLLHKLSGKQTKIMKTMSKRQKELFLEIAEISSALEAENSLSNFKHGFKLGLSLGIEVAIK